MRLLDVAAGVNGLAPGPLRLLGRQLPAGYVPAVDDTRSLFVPQSHADLAGRAGQLPDAHKPVTVFCESVHSAEEAWCDNVVGHGEPARHLARRHAVRRSKWAED